MKCVIRLSYDALHLESLNGRDEYGDEVEDEEAGDDGGGYQVQSCRMSESIQLCAHRHDDEADATQNCRMPESVELCARIGIMMMMMMLMQLKITEEQKR